MTEIPATPYSIREFALLLAEMRRAQTADFSQDYAMALRRQRELEARVDRSIRFVLEAPS